MPEIGEIETRVIKRLNRPSGSGFTHIKYIYISCPNCQKKRWVRLVKGLPRFARCRECEDKRRVTLRWQDRSRNPAWKGGHIKRLDGYIALCLPRDDFFFSMADSNGYILEHRLMMAKHLRRCLLVWEIVHHKNHIRDDNRLENLQLVSEDRHSQITLLENKVKRLEDKVSELKKVYRLQTWRIKELEKRTSSDLQRTPQGGE